jgi:hypothetical protein
VPIFLKSGNLNLIELSEPLLACNKIALLLQNDWPVMVASKNNFRTFAQGLLHKGTKMMTEGLVVD